MYRYMNQKSALQRVFVLCFSRATGVTFVTIVTASKLYSDTHNHSTLTILYS